METARSFTIGEFSTKLVQILAPLLIAIAIVLNILAFIYGLHWADQPYFNILFYPHLVIADAYNSDLSSRYPTLQIDDVLTHVDGTPVSSGQELSRYLLIPRIEKRVTLFFVQSNPLPVSLTTFSLQDLLWFFWLPYGIGLIYLALGLVIYRLRRADRVSRVFVSFCALVSVFLGGLFDQFTLHLLTPVWLIAFPLFGASLLHLSFIFPVETRLARRNPRLIFWPYLLASILVVINLFSFYLTPDSRIFLRIWTGNFVFNALAVIVFLILLLNTGMTTFSNVVRQQITIIFWGSLVSFGPVSLWALANGLNFELPFTWFNLTTVLACFIIFPIVVAYTALRYRLLDLDLIFGQTVVYTLLTLLVTAIYFLLVSFLAVQLRDLELFKNPVVFTIFILFLVIALGPVRERLQGFVSRTFLRETSDYRQAQQRYGQSLISAPLDIDHILKLLLQQTDEALGPQQILVFLRDPNTDMFTIRDQHPGRDTHPIEISFGRKDELVRWLAETKDILQLSPTGVVSPLVKINREELARLSMLNVIVCVPFLGAEQLLGWLALGVKKSGRPYTSNDLLFLATLASQTTISLESAELLEQANQRTAELETLQKVSADIQTEAEPDLLLSSIIRRATALLQAAGGLFYLLEPDEETLKAVTSYNLGKDYSGHTLKKGEDVAGQVMQRGEPIIIENYQTFPGRSPQFESVKLGAVLGVPLQWGGKVQGVLELTHRGRNMRFSERDVSLMELFAAQAAIALEKSRLLKEAHHRANQLAALSEVSVAISSTLNLDIALQRVMNGAVQILNAEAGSLLLVDPRGKELTFEVVLGPTGQHLLGLKTQIGKGIVGTVAQTGQPMIVNDAPSDPRWNIAFDEATKFQTRDILCVPMLAHDRVVGVVEVINKQDGTIFNEEECSLLMSFGAQAAIAIENAQIFTRVDKALSERVQELQALQMIDHELQASLELKTVLDISLTRAMDALGVEMGLMGVLKGQEVEEGLYLLAQRGMPMEMSRYKKDPWPLKRGILGRVARTGELAWVNDISQDKDYTPNSFRTRSMLVAPVMREDKVIGVLDLESTHPDYFTSDDVAFVKLLIGPAAITIQNAQLFEQVKEAHQAKSEFMDVAAHDMKLPMTNIKGYAKLLQMTAGGNWTDQQKEFLAIISNNVDRMDRLVKDLLDISRIEAGRIRLEIENVQMRDVIQEVITSVKNQIQSKNLVLTVDVANDLPELRADYSRMVQIVTNLISNAYKYTPAGGAITVIAKPYLNDTIDGISVTVKDTGYGISTEDQSRLFTKFFRASDQNIRDEPGTGLGLSITKTMIETHGGELTFESELGKGTAFTFTLPLVCQIPPGVEVVER